MKLRRLNSGGEQGGRFTKVKKWLIIGLGFVILIIGIIMIFLPGPGILFILLGLGILSRELRWARNILVKVRNKLRRKRRNQQAASPPQGNSSL